MFWWGALCFRKMAKLFKSKMSSKNVSRVHSKAANSIVGEYACVKSHRKDKGIARGPLTSAQKAQRAAARSIRLHTDTEIKSLGPLTKADIAAIIEGLKAPHCAQCTERCPGCKSGFWSGCSVPHTCGRPTTDQFWKDDCALLCHARRPCRVTAEQAHANQWQAWHSADAAESASLAASAT